MDRLDSVLKGVGCCFSPSGKTSAMPPHQPPPPERTGQRLTSLFFSCLLGPSAAERGPCGPDPQLEGRGVSQLPRRQHPRRRWVRGSAHPAPGPGRGGARPRLAPLPRRSSDPRWPQSPPPAGSWERDLGPGVRAGLRARARPPLPVSPWAGGAVRGGRRIRTRLLGSPRAQAPGCQDRDCGGPWRSIAR